MQGKIGLDLERFKAEMDSGVHAQQILKDREQSIIKGVSGAPTIFVNGQLWAMSGVKLVRAVQDLAEGTTA